MERARLEFTSQAAAVKHFAHAKDAPLPQPEKPQRKRDLLSSKALALLGIRNAEASGLLTKLLEHKRVVAEWGGKLQYGLQCEWCKVDSPIHDEILEWAVKENKNSSTSAVSATTPSVTAQPQLESPARSVSPSAGGVPVSNLPALPPETKHTDAKEQRERADKDRDDDKGIAPDAGLGSPFHQLVYNFKGETLLLCG